MNKINKGIILLSGGLDSLVSIAAMKTTDFQLALTFDYGQKSFKKEEEASKKIAQFYGIEHKIIELKWLKEITQTSLVSDKKIPELDKNSLDNLEITTGSCASVWVPNRNGLFVNIAAAFADSLGYETVVIGANKEEAATFPDNSKEFIENINKSLKYSALKKVEVVAPLIDLNKEEIIKRGIEEDAPIELINSCYASDERHCGKCESCSRLRRALENNGCFDLIKKLF
ncbi:TPA: 7-cyano-7-deazaguanine synthase QueC [Candidatus Spyradomonas excrementavium]|nr:7-cyano-7-deazaguanine synthase QueC [Candidatus Spyradomonas excrementavium]